MARQDQAKYKALPDPRYDKAHPKQGAGHYRPNDFSYDAEAGTCICPADGTTLAHHLRQAR